jgi:hypothetical protein
MIPFKAYASIVAYPSDQKIYERISEVANNIEEADVNRGQ